MTIETFINYTPRLIEGGLDETGEQFFNIVIVRVTGALNTDDGRRWIADEEIVATKTVMGEGFALEAAQRMIAEARAND